MAALRLTGCASCLLSAGLAAGLVAPVVAATESLPWTAASVALSAAVLPLDSGTPTAATDAAQTAGTGDFIINAYNLIQPYVQWGFEVAAWVVSYLPWPLGYLGQQINILYDAFEPIAQALVYSAAFLLDGQFDLIVPVLTNGINAAVTYFVQGEVAWLLSFLPPLPPPLPFPIWPFAAAAPAAATGGADADSAPAAGSGIEPAEVTPEQTDRGDVRRGAVRAQRAGAVRASGAPTPETPAADAAANAVAPAAAEGADETATPAAGTPDRGTDAGAAAPATAGATKAGAARAGRRG